jgi:hypothetical protein
MTTRREIAEQIAFERNGDFSWPAPNGELGWELDRTLLANMIELALQAERRRAIEEAAKRIENDRGATPDQRIYGAKVIRALLSPPSPPAETNDD